jgi:hypothetical protein
MFHLLLALHTALHVLPIAPASTAQITVSHHHHGAARTGLNSEKRQTGEKSQDGSVRPGGLFNHGASPITNNSPHSPFTGKDSSVMSNVCNFQVRGEGPPADLQVLAGLVFQDSRPGLRAWAWNPHDTDPGAAPAAVWLKNLALKTEWGRVEEGRTYHLDVDGESRWVAPWDAVKGWALAWPNLVFTLRYSVDGCWDCGTWRLHGAEETLQEHHCGWFDLHRKAPVHHWWVALHADREAEMLDHLAEAGVTLAHTEVQPSIQGGRVTRTPPARVEALLRAAFPGEPLEVESYPFTLDEATFCNSLAARADPQLLALARRDLALTDAEQEWLQGRAQMERVSEAHGYEANPVVSAERAVLLAAGAPPLGPELTYLLQSGYDRGALQPPGRAAQIREALAHPRWAVGGVWPPWDQKEVRPPVQVRASLQTVKQEARKRHLGVSKDRPASLCQECAELYGPDALADVERWLTAYPNEEDALISNEECLE